jgi:hypothetical protein
MLPGSCILRGSILPGLDATLTAWAATSFDGVGGVAAGGLWCGPGVGGSNRLIGRDAGDGSGEARITFKDSPDNFGM